MRYPIARCPSILGVRKMSGRGGFPSVWFVQHKCRLDDGHAGAHDFTRGKRITTTDVLERFEPFRVKPGETLEAADERRATGPVDR